MFYDFAFPATGNDCAHVTFKCQRLRQTSSLRRAGIEKKEKNKEKRKTINE